MSVAIADKPQSVAPGTYLGFGLQAVRLCYYLLSESGDKSVSVEYADDIAVHSSQNVILEQTKSATAQNPVSNLAVELWKTFSNWIDGIDGGTIDLDKTTFRLYVTPKHTGRIVAALSNAATDSAADRAVELVAKELAAQTKRVAVQKHIKKFLDFDAKKRRKLIKRFTLESVHDDPVDAIRKLLSATLSGQMVDTSCAFAIGKAKESADALIRGGKPAVISADAFQKAFRAFVRKHDLNGLLVSLAPIPNKADVEKTLAESPMFVRQLEIVEMPSETKLQAVSDYLQASVNKTRWAESGHIVADSFKDFDRDLVRQHGFIKLELEDTTRDPKRLGRALYSRCARSSATLEGREVPGHFIPGCFNDLADRRELGWHPDFKSLLAD